MHIYAYLKGFLVSEDFGLKKHLDESYAIFITFLLKCLSGLVLMTSSILSCVLQAKISTKPEKTLSSNGLRMRQVVCSKTSNVEVGNQTSLSAPVQDLYKYTSMTLSQF